MKQADFMIYDVAGECCLTLFLGAHTTDEKKPVSNLAVILHGNGDTVAEGQRPARGLGLVGVSEGNHAER